MTAQRSHVFISYQRSDEVIARQVRDELTTAGVRTWMDQYDIPVGAYWPDEIDKGLAASYTVVGVLSPDAAESRNVKNEWDWAIQNGKRLLILLVQPCVIPHRYVSINFIDASRDPDAGIRQLAAVLGQSNTTSATQSPDTQGRPSPRYGRPDIPERTEPFVGREREMAEATTALTAALHGQRQLLLLAGEPGIGKTRLAETLARQASLNGAQVYWGRCFEWEGAPPYWPWIEVLRAYIESLEPALLVGQLGTTGPFLTQIIPELAGMLDDLPPLPPMDPDQARFRLFDAVARCLRQAASQQPFVAVLDDLHWADEPSLRLIEFVARELQSAPLLLVGTFRDTEVRRDHPLGRSLAALARAAEPRRITLKRLPATSVGEYIQEATGVDVSTSLVEAVSEGTDGNPFYLGEVVRLLQAEGRLDHEAGTVTSLDVILPESVRDVVGRRLDRLSSDCNAVLAIGSVIGREFTLSLLERASRRSSGDLLDLLDEAGAAHIVEASAVFGQYRFSHAFIQQTLYDELSTANRVRLHGQVGQALEELYATDLSSHYDELAHHFANSPVGDNLQKAITYTRSAGARAMVQLAWETAVHHYQRALQLLDIQQSPEPLARYEILLALGEAHYQITADSLDAQGFLEQAAAIAQTLGDPKLLARAAISLHGYNLFESYGRVEHVSLLREALDGLQPGESILRARVLSQLAIAERTFLITPDRTRSLCEEGIAIARRLGDPATLAYALAVRHAILANPDNLDERIADATEIIRLADAAGNLTLSAWGHFWRRSNLLELGNAAGAIDAIDTLLEIADKLRAHVFHCVSNETRAMRVLMAGEFREAELVIQQVTELHISQYQRDGDWGFRALQWLPYAYMLRREQGRLSELDGETQRFRGNCNAPFFRILRLLLSLDLGNIDEAQAEWSAIAANDFADVPRDSFWMGKIALLAEACHALNDDRRAYVLTQMLTPYAGRIVVDGPNSLCHCSVTHYLGLLATTLTDWEIGTSFFEMALSTHIRSDLKPHAAHTRYAFADMLARRNEPGDQERALNLVDEAAAAAQQMGMTRLVALADALRRRIQTRDLKP